MLAIVTSASAEAPQVRTQAPGFYRVMVGDFEVTVLLDGTHPFPDGFSISADQASWIVCVATMAEVAGNAWARASECEGVHTLMLNADVVCASETLFYFGTYPPARQLIEHRFSSPWK